MKFFYLFFFLLLFSAFSFSQKTQPNIIFIMTDQQRSDALGCMENSVVISPNIDKIAEEGVTFVNGYSSVPSCTPARSGLLTGLSPWHHGMLGYGRVARKYKYEMPQMLREAGYYTFGIGKMHWFPQKALHGFYGTLTDESGRVEQDGYVSDYRDWFKLNAPGEDPDKTGIGWNEHNSGIYQLDEKLHPTYWTGNTAVELIKNYWAALTDGTWKYIWFFRTGKEQLFNLKNDPGEITELSNKNKDELKKWRKNMVNHLSERGEEFVKNGELVVCENTLLYSPNYPKDERTENERINEWREIYKGN